MEYLFNSFNKYSPSKTCVSDMSLCIFVTINLIRYVLLIFQRQEIRSLSSALVYMQSTKGPLNRQTNRSSELIVELIGKYAYSLRQVLVYVQCTKDPLKLIAKYTCYLFSKSCLLKLTSSQFLQQAPLQKWKCLKSLSKLYG